MVNPPTRVRLPFLGHYPGLIDDKGRLSIPADYRHALSPECDGTLVMTPGNGPYLNAFPLDQFNAIWEHADPDALGFATEDSLARDAAVLSPAVSRQLDSQGRITVPQNLLRESDIGREVVFMGRWNHFVIWDAKAFEAFQATHKLTPGSAWQKLIEQSRKA